MKQHARKTLTIGIAATLASACIAAGLSESPGQPKDAGNPKPGSVQPISPSMEKDRPAASLKVGDAAPPIKVDEWVKGEAVGSFDKGKVYVVEFWATWCPPCRAAIPHLTTLQREYKDVTIIGVTGSERRPESGPDKRLDNLKKFVKDQGDSMNYRVAYDSDREMVKDWMEAAGRN
ncbi:MAG TPA: redoxin family protein, partial [Phycisphaerales bacterium]|nr:redoxin family protein [Phycisphaerales bacterium]